MADRRGREVRAALLLALLFSTGPAAVAQQAQPTASPEPVPVPGRPTTGVPELDSELDEALAPQGSEGAERPSDLGRGRLPPGMAPGSGPAEGATPAPADPERPTEDVPYLSGRIVDEAGLLSPEAEARIGEKMAALERDTGAQLAVLTIPTLGGEPIEDYSLRVAETWKLGRKETDDGVLLLIARDDRRMRIETGYGVEGQLTDLQSSRILDGILRPAFRGGDYEGGIEQGVDAIGTALRGGEVAAPEEPGDLRGGARILAGGGLLLILGVFALAALFTGGCAGWFLYVFLTPFWYSLPVAFGLGTAFGPVAAGAWLIGFPILKLLVGGGRGKGGWGGGTGRRRSGWGGPLVFPVGWGSGGGGSWSSRGGGWGGGFSGGGGSFGGGGASGSW